uniref:Uncharacterized protein n=1 Tax=Salarias fasciatus TaxID=181472 RepID=A0A672I7R8_SALFA
MLQSEPEMAVNIAVASSVLLKEESSSSERLGPAFPFVKALKAVNAKLKENYPESEELFKVMLLDEKPSDSLKNAIRTHDLEELITVLNVREDLVGELKRINTALYLSDSEALAKKVLNQGIAAAFMPTPKEIKEVSEDQLRVAFDGDSVLFSNESERVFQDSGLTGYLQHERNNVEKLLDPGPLCSFLEVLEKLKKKLHDKGLLKNCPIRTYLVTARRAGCDGYRALNSLHSWDLEVDEAFFLGLSPKGPILDNIRPHLFFDDQPRHIQAALEMLQSEPEMAVNIAVASSVLLTEESSSSERLGPAFPFVKALKAVNAKLKENYPESEELFKVMLLDEKPSDSLKNAIRTHGEFHSCVHQ